MHETSGKRPLFAGFDLGTTNSVAAVFDGTDVKVVRNSSGGALTPSVVRVDARGRQSVGQRALRLAEREPQNTHREFKRLMGTAQALHFVDANVSRLPQQLSAAVLEALRKDVQDVTGVLPERAVISVPALFELPQSAATSEAAQLAGFTQVELLQEPIASALAAGWSQSDSGSWLVFDFGGGTFDVSLLETRDGLLRVVAHDGDNFLGGRDLDRAIVAWAVDRLMKDTGISIDRGNASHAGALLRLGIAAETAKIELSRAQEADILLDGPLEVDGREIDVDLVLDRATLEILCRPIVARTIAVCRRLLARQGLDAEQLSRVVLVGGPTVMPLVRREVTQALRIPIAEGFDPMTLVAQGAALYAATAGLDARPTSVSVRDPDAVSVWCQYPPVTADLQPHVIGRFEATTKTLPSSVELVRLNADGTESWRSEPVVLDDEASFVLTASLKPHCSNRFLIVAKSAKGATIATNPAEISVVHGVTIGDPPLSRSIGVALANNVVHVYFERGVALPARRTFTHRTVEAVSGGSGNVLSVPIVQGEFEDAHLCRLVGSLKISGAEVEGTIATGTPVQVTLVVDRGGKLSATARIKRPDDSVLTFEGIAQLIMPEATTDSIGRSLSVARKRVIDAQSEAFTEGDREAIDELGELERRLNSVDSLMESLAGGDTDAGQKAARILLETDAELSEREEEKRWPEIQEDAEDTYAWALSWVGENGRESEMRLVERAGQSLDQAIERGSVRDVNRQLRILRRIGSTCFRRDPESWQMSFEHCIAKIEEATDLPAAKKLESRGHKAIKKNDTEALRAVVEQLWELFPADPEVRRMSYESGVR